MKEFRGLEGVTLLLARIRVDIGKEQCLVWRYNRMTRRVRACLTCVRESGDGIRMGPHLGFPLSTLTRGARVRHVVAHKGACAAG
ncbi:hypothetical protein E2562_037225 [Oryza meyeriana var. granulata]|uniref:Uncharacterized protein n=1 Tax=Oryza meyeriana var. granulata TaxID=110450 RepID=A0A6G1ETQ8_9ORYZ|nr:hypothetical protein E2562_037225 [Oryza meyeriana var. granulata]